MPIEHIREINSLKIVTPVASRVAIAGMNFDEILAMMPKRTTGILEIDKWSSNISISPCLHTSQLWGGCSLWRSKIGEVYGNPTKPESIIDEKA